ncbi:MAG: DUF2145 domain-containing protein [Pseudomonadota bacterium]
MLNPISILWLRFSGIAAALAVVLTLLIADPALAGQPCEQRSHTVEQLSNGMELASRTARALDREAVSVGVIARMGQDLSKWQQRYSHIGLVYRSSEPGADPIWRVVHKLNDCGSDRANVYRQGLAEFFTDGPFDWETAIVPLTPEFAEEILPALTDDPKLLTGLHEPRYSMVSYVWGTRYQQSNQWALETLAMLLNPEIRTRRQAQRWLMAESYRADRLRLGTLTRLGARVTKANVAFDDHPSRLRFTGRIDTTTADSVLRWLEGTEFGEARFVVRLN